MARSFVAASSDFLEHASAVVTAAPLTMACWGYFDDRTVTATLMCLGVAAVDGNYFAIDMSGTEADDPIRAITSAGVGGFLAGSVAGPTTDNTWGHCAGVFTSATSRIAYFNGTAGVAETTSSTPAGLDRTDIGRLLYEGGVPVNYMSGRIAEPAIWNVALTAAEITSLVRGVSPLLIRPSALIFYAPLIRELIDVRGGATLTATGTTVVDHPRMYYAAGSVGIGVPAAAAATGLPNLVGPSFSLAGHGGLAA